MQKILQLYKLEGETPLQTLERFRNENPIYADIKMTYAGRLDPMASGMLLVLCDDEVYNKEQYTSLDKVYEVDVLFGFATDSHDILGLVTETFSGDFSFEKEDFLSRLEMLKGKRQQTYPLYSSKTVHGKQLWQHAREHNEQNIMLPVKEVEIFDIEIINQGSFSRNDLLEKIIQRIEQVAGDFRQREIREQWNQILKKTEISNFPYITIRVHCSSGTYMRSLAHALGKSLQVVALAWRIKRIQIGEWKLSL